jgi:Ion transport protein
MILPTAAELIPMTNTRSSETTPLISTHEVVIDEVSIREKVFAFLEAKSPAGRIYERFTMILIVINVLAFIVATLFVEEYNPEPWAMRDGGICGKLCDALWFGNYKDNGLEFLQMGTTSILEVVTVFVFSIDYLSRIWTADLENERFEGVVGRLKYLPTFYSIVDLASTVPFYVDAFVLTHSDLVASQVRVCLHTFFYHWKRQMFFLRKNHC